MVKQSLLLLLLLQKKLRVTHKSAERSTEVRNRLLLNLEDVEEDVGEENLGEKLQF